MHVNQLIYFSKVVESSTIRSAAQKLHISQPALSKSIKELEKELGQQLFFRTTQGIQPTEMGWKIYEEFQNIKPIIDGLYTTNHTQETKKSIYISCIHSANSMVLNQIVLPFKKSHTNIDIIMKNQFVPEVFDTLKNSPVNIAITSLPQLEEESFLVEVLKKQLNIHYLFDGTRCLVISTTHHLANKTELNLSDLKHLSLVTYSTSQDRPSVIYSSYFNNLFKLANKESIMEMVVKNEAVWLPVKELVKNDFYIRNHLVKIFPIPIAEINHKVSIVAITTSSLSSIENEFIYFLKDHLHP